jgi:hypothetical protein
MKTLVAAIRDEKPHAFKIPETLLDLGRGAVEFTATLVPRRGRPKRRCLKELLEDDIRIKQAECA